MTQSKNIQVAIFLFISGLMLSSLVPGGPIENRDFSHINPAILLSFNVFLTFLGLGSFLLMAYVLKKGKYASVLSIIAGASYAVVYGIDLVGVFPKTPTPMSSALLWVELLGTLIAIPLIIAASHLKPQGESAQRFGSSMSKSAWFAIAVVGLVIIMFATFSAMTPSA